MDREGLLSVLSPIVWLLSGFSSLILALFRIKVGKKELPRLSRIIALDCHGCGRS